jgi:hypothetical protein
MISVVVLTVVLNVVGDNVVPVLLVAVVVSAVSELSVSVLNVVSDIVVPVSLVAVEVSAVSELSETVSVEVTVNV